MKPILAILLLAASSALAQQKPSDAMIQGTVAEIERQRDAANTRAAQLAGMLADAQEQAKAEIERMKKLCGKPCEPEDKKK